MQASERKGGQSLPHSLEAERAVLGSVLRTPENLILIEGVLRPDQFFFSPHSKVFEVILGLSAANEPADVVTVAERLRGVDEDREHLSAGFLIELIENCPVTQNIEYYANIVRTDYYRRRVILTCQGIIRDAMAYDGSVEEFVGSFESEFLSISREYDRKGVVLAGDVLDRTIEEIQKRIENGDKITGVPSGFSELDNLIGGFQPSDLVIIAARPAMGKTAFALNCAANAAHRGKKVLVFTLEMTKEQLMSRILSSEACVDSSRLRKGDLSPEEQDRLIEGARQIYAINENLGIDETPSISLAELRSRCRRHHKEFGLNMVMIDYLQLMGSANKKFDSREREISEISMGLKALAKELSVPVIALAQLNRGPDARPDKRPKISDLRESGSMEQDADMIMFLYRDEYYNPASEDTGIAELIVAKNRHGSTSKIKLAFHPNFVAFKDLYQEGSIHRAAPLDE